MGVRKVRLQNDSFHTQEVRIGKNHAYTIHHGDWINVASDRARSMLGKKDKRSNRKIWRLVDGHPEALEELTGEVIKTQEDKEAALAAYEKAETKVVGRGKRGTRAKGASSIPDEEMPAAPTLERPD